MRVVDPHIDIADMAQLIGFSIADFYSDLSTIPVSLEKLKKSVVSLVGLSLYYDQSLVTSSFYDGVKESIQFYNELIERTGNWHKISFADDLAKLPEDKIGYFFSIEGLDR